jgi:tetratricopeptide (TPR) repeat protein
MKIALEEFIPYDRSLQWRLHDAYFARRGAAAWTAGEVPYHATSNFAIARQHALFLDALASDLEKSGALRKGEPFHVLEVGSGLGRFAANLFRAIDEGRCGAAGKRLAPRLRYILSDYSEASIREAVRVTGLEKYATAGRLIPALFDLRKPRELYDLSRRTIAVPLAATIANYVCDAAPAKVIRKTKDGAYAEKYVRVVAEVEESESTNPAAAERILREYLEKSATRPGFLKDLQPEIEWRSTELGAIFPQPFHATVMKRLLDAWPETTIVYPYVFLDFLRAVEQRMLKGGVAIVNDFGSPESRDSKGLSDRRPSIYDGNAIFHGVHFPIFDEFAVAAGLSVARTKKPARSIHSALVQYSRELRPAVRSAHHRFIVERQDGEDLIDFSTAAREEYRLERYARAVRLYERCLKLDPGSAELLYRTGEACVDAGLPGEALKYLKRGRSLPGGADWDFDFQIGRAFYRLERLKDAAASYTESIAKRDDPVARTNLGAVYEEWGKPKDAYREYKKALDLDPKYERATTLLNALVHAWAEKTLRVTEKGPASAEKLKARK